MPGAVNTRPAQASLTPADDPTADGFTFPLNPNSIERTQSNVYAEVGIPLDDQNPERAGPDPYEWVRNRPEEIRIKSMLHNAKDDEDIEDDLKRLDDLRRKDTRTGAPKRLIFRFGPRRDLVVISDKQVTEKMWTPDLRCQWAEVSLTLKVLRPRY